MKRHFFLGIILLFSIQAAHCKRDPQHGILYSTAPSAEMLIGSFQLIWNADSLKLSVYHQDYPGHLHWSTVSGHTFLTAETGEAAFEDKRGTFILHEQKKKVVYRGQSLDAISNDGTACILSGKLFTDNGDTCSYEIHCSADEQGHLQMNVQTDHSKVNRLQLHWQAYANEVITGLGEQPSHFNHKGKKVPILVQEQGIGRGDIRAPVINLVLGPSTGHDYTSYKSVPHILSSKGQSLYLKNLEYAAFDFSQSSVSSVRVFSGNMRLAIVPGRSPKELVESYTLYSGRMRRLPEWVHSGAIIGMQGGTEKVRRVWQTLKEAEVPVTAFWLQDWVGQRKTIIGKQLWWNWELDSLHYPNWQLLLKELTAAEVSVMGYVNPFLVDVAGQKPHFRRNLYQEALDSGFLVLNDKGVPYLNVTSFKAALFDLSHPACRTWIKGIIKSELIANGFKGWMADFGEALPFEVQLHNETGTASWHNRYAEEWAKINLEAIQEAGVENEATFFSRSAFTRSPGYATLFWQGDQMVNWGENDGLPSAVTGLLTGGYSGFTLNHSDIGGYASIDFPLAQKVKRSPELLRRWIELAAFTPVFRTHEGLGPDKNYQVYSDREIAAYFARWAKIFLAWKPYREVLLDEAAQKGWPLVRHMSFEFPNESKAWQVRNTQYMLGSDFLIVPVLKEGVDKISVWFPPGQWVNAWNPAEVHQGAAGNAELEGYADRPGVFYRKGSSFGEAFSQAVNQ